jgi:hypothetical protein
MLGRWSARTFGKIPQKMVKTYKSVKNCFWSLAAVPDDVERERIFQYFTRSRLRD